MRGTGEKELIGPSPSDPNLSPGEILRLAVEHPAKVLANPALPLIALEDPTLWRRITTRARLELANRVLEERLSHLGERERRQWACDCAERVLPQWEHRYPRDLRPRRALTVARAYARGEATEEARRKARHEAEGAAWGPSCPERTAACAALWAVTAPSDCESAPNSHSQKTGLWATLQSQYQNPAREAASWAARAAMEAAKDIEKHILEKQWQIERLAWYLTTF